MADESERIAEREANRRRLLEAWVSEAHPDEYAAWMAAPWAETVQKAEDANTADYHLAAALKKLKAERKARLEKLASDMQAEADKKTAAKAR